MMILNKNRRLSPFEWILLLVSVIIFTLGFISSLAAYISPAKSWMIALIGIAFPFIYLINLLFLVIWFFKKKWPVLLHLLVLLIGFNTAGNQWAWNKKENFKKDENTLSVMSFNVRNFDFYNWKGNYYGTSTARQDIFRLISELNPDVVCFQEFFHCDTGKYRTIQMMTDSLGYKFHFVRTPVQLKKIYHFGMAIFSRYPIVNSTEIPIHKPGNMKERHNINLCLQADINFKGETIRIYNIHFQSFMFRSGEYAMVVDNRIAMNEQELKSIKALISRMKLAYLIRTLQIQKIATELHHKMIPVILCCDFNDTPSSWAYRMISNRLHDSFLAKGHGVGISYAGPFPAFRIDYIFYSHELSCISQKTIYKKLSDHYPNFASFHLRDKD
ncbi:MAG: endonuclease/exonuclease/phosphatase family protein [Bacteroidia bacterium]|nr:endonuclease/exonuclease/phosphatase family protein [Bacteroidia bacterium]MCZ2276981.1 endonuclease/exonuclease/phosphatase family protein [Bacteroidia bacterium]